MSEYSMLFERAAARHAEPDLSVEGLLFRRDRKRRNQRIRAGFTGIAVFVGAVLIVTTVAFDPAPERTRPADVWSAAAPIWGGQGPQYYLPAEGEAPSTPEAGRLVASLDRTPQPQPDVRSGGIRGYMLENRFVFVYADGRVLSWVGPRTSGPVPDPIFERRLTREGVEQVRSGALPLVDLFGRAEDEVPSDVWEDAQPKPFVPSRYDVCYSREGDSAASEVVRFFPAPARAILDGEMTSDDPACSSVTTEEARALVDMLGSMNSVLFATPHARVEDAEGDRIDWVIAMILPHGERPPCDGCA